MAIAPGCLFFRVSIIVFFSFHLQLTFPDFSTPQQSVVHNIALYITTGHPSLKLSHVGDLLFSVLLGAFAVVSECYFWFKFNPCIVRYTVNFQCNSVC